MARVSKRARSGDGDGGPGHRLARCPTFVERYYSIWERGAKEEDPGNGTVLLVHNIGVGMATLGPQHAAVRKGVRATAFRLNDGTMVPEATNPESDKYKVDLSRLSASGKGKKDAPLIKSRAVVGIMEFEDGSSLPLCCGVSGRVLEVNPRVLADPNLALEQGGLGTGIGWLFMADLDLSLRRRLEEGGEAAHDWTCLHRSGDAPGDDDDGGD
jgi:hypothetical protein